MDNLVYLYNFSPIKSNEDVIKKAHLHPSQTDQITIYGTEIAIKLP